MEGVEEVFKMKKKEIQEIYDLFITCLPKNCIKPKGIKIYSSWKKMIHEGHSKLLDWIRDTAEENCGAIIGEIDIVGFNWEKVKRRYRGVKFFSTLQEKYKIPEVGKWPPGFASDPISMYSRGFKNDMDFIIFLMHEIGHLNVGRREKKVDDWMKARWPYVYGRYKKLKI